MRILLTGGTGLIGRALCQHWQRQGHDLFVWSRDPAQVPRLCSGAQGIAQLQALMDRFSEVIGISNSIVDSDGTRLTSSGWEDACTHFHRANPASFRRCAASDTSLLDDSGGKT